ncbi:MAG: phospholipid-binding protein MlaC [Candidatus Binatia bacterium]
MNRRHSALRTGIWMTLLAFPLSAWAVESPLETVRTTIERATLVLQNPAYQGREHLSMRVQKVREVVEPQFDVQEIARRTLGTYWQQRTEAERKEFIQLFTEFVQKTYSGMLDRYTANVEFLYDQERVDDKFAEVDTRIFDPAQNKAFAVTYKMHRINGKWLVYDVVAENVSMVRNYRNQFSRIINKSSYQDLLEALQNKIKELDAPPSSTQAHNATAG